MSLSLSAFFRHLTVKIEVKVSLKVLVRIETQIQQSNYT